MLKDKDFSKNGSYIQNNVHGIQAKFDSNPSLPEKMVQHKMIKQPLAEEVNKQMSPCLIVSSIPSSWTTQDIKNLLDLYGTLE